MAYDISGDNYLEKTKIDLSAEFGDGAFVELREPTKREYLVLSKAYQAGALDFEDAFSAMLPGLIVGHGFAMQGVPAKPEQVRDAICKKTAASNKVQSDFFAWATAPFQKQTEGK
jgi:hypothetical protein